MSAHTPTCPCVYFYIIAIIFKNNSDDSRTHPHATMYMEVRSNFVTFYLIKKSAILNNYLASRSKCEVKCCAVGLYGPVVDYCVRP